VAGSPLSALSGSLVSAQATATAAPAAGSEAYIVEQLKADRLQPAGTDGHYQPVKLISRRTLETDSRLALLHDGKSEPLSFEMDAYFSNRFSQARR